MSSCGYLFIASLFTKPLAASRQLQPPGARDAPNQQAAAGPLDIPRLRRQVVSEPPEDEIVVVGESDEKTVPVPKRMGATRALSNAISHSTVVKTRFVDLAGLTTSAGGSIYFASNLYTLLVALGEEDDMQALFREFRITNFRVHYVPYTPNKVEAATNTNGRPFVMAIDPDDASAPGSSIQLYANVTAKLLHTQREATLSWRNDDKRWFSTSSTTNPLQPPLSLKGAVDANAGTSIPVGALYMEFFVEYRARL